MYEAWGTLKGICWGDWSEWRLEERGGLGVGVGKGLTFHILWILAK